MRRPIGIFVVTLAIACLGLTAAAGAQTQEPLFALLSQSIGFGANSIEIVDLQTTPPTQIAVFPLDQPRDVPSMAVSADGARIYVVSRTNNEVVVFDPMGTRIASIMVFDSPNDAVLSPDGATLYVSAAASILAIDTATNSVRIRVTGTDLLRGIAITDDGSTVGAAVTTGGSDTTRGTSPGLQLFSAATLATIAGVPLSDGGCSPFPREVAFMETGDALVWDAFCGKVYRVDVVNQIHSSTITVSGDGGVFFPNHNSFTYSAVRGLAYAARVDGEVNVIDPAGQHRRIQPIAVRASLDVGQRGAPCRIDQSVRQRSSHAGPC